MLLDAWVNHCFYSYLFINEINLFLSSTNASADAVSTKNRMSLVMSKHKHTFGIFGFPVTLA